jgi:hypothetical protein
MHTIAWTGHRPKDLPPLFTYLRFRTILDTLGMGTRKDVKFIVGGALGIDSFAARYALDHDIPFELHLPFQPATQSRGWSEADRNFLDHCVIRCEKLVVLGSDIYEVQRYQERNVSMVDAANTIFTVWTGKHIGGTANCIRYALDQLKPVYNLFPFDGKLHRVREA